jgi:hypothetical protein
MKIVEPLLNIQNQFRVFHWQTDSYGQHKAFGKFYENFDDLVDTFVEVYFGKYGKPDPRTGYNIELLGIEAGYERFINQTLTYLYNLSNELDSTKDSELLNIRDEMLAEVNRLKYLLTLNK